MEIVVSVNVSQTMFHQIIFVSLIVSSLSCNFNRCVVCFQSFMNVARRYAQNTARIKHFLRLHIVVKPLNKKIKRTNSLLCWSVTLLSHFLPVSPVGTLWQTLDLFPLTSLCFSYALHIVWTLNEFASLLYPRGAWHEPQCYFGSHLQLQWLLFLSI